MTNCNCDRLSLVPACNVECKNSFFTVTGSFVGQGFLWLAKQIIMVFFEKNKQKNKTFFMSKGKYSIITNWHRTFGSKASIPERKASCAEAKATTRLRRICTCSCLKSLDMGAKGTLSCDQSQFYKLDAHRSHLSLFSGVSSNFIIYTSLLSFSMNKTGRKKDAFDVVL